MPEVCEIALTAEILNEELENSVLTDYKIIDSKFKKVKGSVDLPLKVLNVDSKGKLLWFHMIDDDNNDVYMTCGFGLEGKWSFSEEKYSKMKFTFEKKKIRKILWWNDIFNYGNIVFYDDKKDFLKKINSLGMDFLKSKYDYKDLYERIKKYKDKMIVELLMDQKKIGSGLGNYLTPEILYRAKIKPSRKAKDLTESDVKVLTKKIKEVLKLCYHSNDNKYLTFLQKYLNKHVREPYLKEIDIDGKKWEFLVYRQKIDKKGNKVIADKLIKGRTTYWVEGEQV